MPLVLIFLLGFAVGAAAALAGRRLNPAMRDHRDLTRSWRTLAVPIVNGSLPRAALITAGRIGAATGGHVALLAVVQVPRGMGIEAGNPPRLQTALTQLEAGEKLVRSLGAEVHGEVVRVRELGELVIHACEETGAQAVVIEPNPASRATNELLHTLVDSKGGRTFDLVLAPPREGDS